MFIITVYIYKYIYIYKLMMKSHPGLCEIIGTHIEARTEYKEIA